MDLRPELSVLGDLRRETEQIVMAAAEPVSKKIRTMAPGLVRLTYPTYFPEETKANPAFQERIKREVPLGRLVNLA